MSTTKPREPLLNPGEFKVRRPEIGLNSIYDMLRSGRIRSIKIGRRYLIPSSEVTEFPRREAVSE